MFLVLAGQKFVFAKGNPFNAAYFLDVAKMIFEKPKPGQTGLWVDVVRICVTHIEFVKDHSDLVHLPLEHEHLAWTLLDETKTVLIGDLKKAESLTAKKVSNFRHLSSRHDDFTGEVLSAKPRVESLQRGMTFCKKKYSQSGNNPETFQLKPITSPQRTSNSKQKSETSNV